MKVVYYLLAAAFSAACVGCFVGLILSCAGACDPMVNVLACIGFVAFSVLAARNWMLAITGKPCREVPQYTFKKC